MQLIVEQCSTSVRKESEWPRYPVLQAWKKVHSVWACLGACGCVWVFVWMIVCVWFSLSLFHLPHLPHLPPSPPSLTSLPLSLSPLPRPPLIITVIANR